VRLEVDRRVLPRPSNRRWASWLSGSRGRPRAVRIRSNGWLGCECPRQPCPAHRAGIISRGSACGEAPPILWRRVRRWWFRRSRRRRNTR